MSAYASVLIKLKCSICSQWYLGNRDGYLCTSVIEYTLLRGLRDWRIIVGQNLLGGIFTLIIMYTKVLMVSLSQRIGEPQRYSKQYN